MDKNMDRSKILIADQQSIEQADNQYWANAHIKEKLQTITYLRECFYGPEATTGRLQKFHQVFKRK